MVGSCSADSGHRARRALRARCKISSICSITNAGSGPWERKPRAHEAADKLATAVSLDMTAHWTPTVRTYLGRVTKAHNLAAVCEAVSDEAAERLSGMKKVPMVEAAEQLLAGAGWLPSLLRTAGPAWAVAEQPEAQETVEVEDAPKADDGGRHSIAAE